MKYTIYGLIDEKENSIPTDYEKRCMLAWLVTHPPLITKEMALKLAKEHLDRLDKDKKC